MKVAQEEIFGPVLSVVRATDLDSVIEMGNQCPFWKWRFHFHQ